MTAHLISPAVGSHFSMYLVDMNGNASSRPLPAEVERFIFVLKGNINVTVSSRKYKSVPNPVALEADNFAYFPPGLHHQLFADSQGAALLVWERKYRAGGDPIFMHGRTSEQPILPVAGEDFLLRKLLPQTTDFDFNIHVMVRLLLRLINTQNIIRKGVIKC